MATRFCSKDIAIFTAMVTTEIANVGMNTLFKAATSKGLSSYVFLVYCYAIGALLLLPFPFFSRRSRFLPPLSFRTISQIALLGLIGCMYSSLGYTGVKYSSPTLASAMSNLTPAFTFILALIFGMEKVSMKKGSSIAKVLGTIVCITGSLVVTLYQGPPILIASQPSVSLRQSPPSDWIIGGGLCALEYTLIPVFYIVQAQIMGEYPCEFTVTQLCSLFTSIFCVLVTLVMERNNASAWILRSKTSFACIFTAGIVNPGCYLIHSWVVRYKGPLFLAMFRPLSILIAVVMGAIFLHDSLYLGSLIGGISITTGFYTVMWGKANEEKVNVEKSNLNYSFSSEKVPLLEASSH